jgi:hypothetical protein
MRLFLTYPCDQEECTPEPVDLAGAAVQWFPATEDSDFRIEFRPEQLPEGKYALRVEASDARGNTSGKEAYEISFVVETETSVQWAKPHPNPFAQDVSFKVVLSGDDLPNDFRLQIVDSRGREIRTFKGTDDLHIGTNVVRWDGKDQAGSTLPPGVYFYSAYLSFGGEVHQQQGKVVLIR